MKISVISNKINPLGEEPQLWVTQEAYDVLIKSQAEGDGLEYLMRTPVKIATDLQMEFVKSIVGHQPDIVCFKPLDEDDKAKIELFNITENIKTK